MFLSTDDKTLDIDYAEQMRRHPFGTALYQPQPRNIFHPGMVGYFDAYGNWNPIIDLSQEVTSPSSDSKTTASFTPLKNLPDLAEPERHEWGPKLGTTTSGRRIDVKAGVSEALMTELSGVPFGIGSCYRFESEKSTGAVLITSNPVVHERFYFESPFKLWVSSNAGRLLAERAELKKHALWVVTSTWASDEVAINCWRDSKRAVEVGFKASFVQIGELAPKGEWVDGGSADGWMRVKGDTSSGSRRVVFFGGLKFKYRPIIGGLGAQDKRTLRGDGEGEEVIVQSLQADDGVEYDLSCEAVLEQEPEVED